MTGFIQHHSRKRVLMKDGTWWVTICWDAVRDSYVLAPENAVFQNLAAQELDVLERLGYVRLVGE